MRPIILLELALLAPTAAAPAQFFDRLSNPTIAVTLNHPPGLGLRVNKVAFGPASGECADQIVEALISDFVAQQIDVVDREHLGAILAEHNLTTSGAVDQTSAAAIGKILGPSALLFVRTQRCATQQDRLYDDTAASRYDPRTKRVYPVRTYYARTRAFLKASIQTVDLATGRIFAARTLDYSPEQRNKSEDGYPDAPTEFDVIDLAVQAAVTDIHRMFLAWSEQTKLIFFDDKDCGLQRAFQALKAQNVDGAFTLSQQNLETCRTTPGVKDKVLGRAYYNMGMSYMMRDDYDNALTHFREAARLRPGDIVTKAIAACQTAKELMVAMQRVEDRAAFETERTRAAGATAARAEAAGTLTNDDVIQMVQSKLSDAIIIHKIKNSKHQFDTTSPALVALGRAGVSEAVIMAMMEP
jgi:tetratricopeptide (TPR) repeat protein